MNVQHVENLVLLQEHDFSLKCFMYLMRGFSICVALSKFMNFTKYYKKWDKFVTKNKKY